MEIAIRNCDFKFRCDKRWEELKKTDNPRVRFCVDCEENIYYVNKPKEIRDAISLNRCIALVVEDSDNGWGSEIVGKIASYD